MTITGWPWTRWPHTRLLPVLVSLAIVAAACTESDTGDPVMIEPPGVDEPALPPPDSAPVTTDHPAVETPTNP